jgi:hypothetical protein
MTWDPGYLKPHGTIAAYRRHYRLGEKPCEPCRQAESRRHADRSPEQRHAYYLASLPAPIVHLGRAIPACGADGLTVALTMTAGGVTCPRCERTGAYQTALARAS